MDRILAISVLVVLAAVGAVIGSGSISTDLPAPKSTFSSTQTKAFRQFELYNAGSEVAGLSLVATLRSDQPRANWVSFIYGECDAGQDGGCAPPAEVQIWPACLRNPAVFVKNLELLRAEDPIILRGVPAIFYEGGTRLEIQTGRSTVVIFGQSRELVSRIASDLEGVNLAVSRTQGLPAPVPGAETGTLRCST